MRMTSMMKSTAVVAAMACAALFVGELGAQAGVSHRRAEEEAVRGARAEARASLAAIRSARSEVALGLDRRSVRAPAGWLQEDPGSEQYARAREALNAGRYQDAAEAFAELRRRHPGSGYVGTSLYYEAFARSRLGGRGQLREAVTLLRRQLEEFPQADTRTDARALMVRVEAQLARRGDAEAGARIAAQAASPCEGEEQAVRAAALSALMNMNAERAIPILREVLESRDECSVELRRQAVFLISQTMSDESVDILLDLAHRNPDPDPEVREQAVFWLSQVHSDEALAALEAILAESGDPEIQEKALFAISQHGSERSMGVLRAFASRADAPSEQRANAIFWIGQSASGEGTEYLIDLYPSLRDPELQERAMFAIAQGNSEASRRWLLERARDRSQSVEARKNALFWAGQTGGLRASELKQLYGTMDDREMKEQLIFVSSQSSEREAVDFLMEVARTEQDGELKELAIFWLGQSKDPRVAEFLLDLIRR